MTVNVAEDGDDAGQFAPLAYFLYFAIFAVLYIVLRKAYSRELMPSSSEIPLILAPFITAMISFGVLTRYMFEDNIGKRIKFGSLVCFVWTILICTLMSVLHLWYLHLAAIGLLFLGFALWDWMILASSRIDDEKKVDVWEGHVFVNVPTIFSVIVIMLFLTVVATCGSWEGAEKINEFRSALEIFTTGVVAFHLGVAACTYVLVSTDYYESVTGICRPHRFLQGEAQSGANKDARKVTKEEAVLPHD